MPGPCKPFILYQGSDSSEAFNSVDVCLKSGNILATRLDKPILTEIDPRTGGVIHHEYSKCAMEPSIPVTCFTGIVRVPGEAINPSGRRYEDFFLVAGGDTTYRHPRRGAWRLFRFDATRKNFSVLGNVELSFAEYITSLAFAEYTAMRILLLVADGGPHSPSVRVVEFIMNTSLSENSVRDLLTSDEVGVRSLHRVNALGIRDLQMEGRWLYFTNASSRHLCRVDIYPSIERGNRIGRVQALPLAGIAGGIAIEAPEDSEFLTVYYATPNLNSVGSVSIPHALHDFRDHDVAGFHPFLGAEDVNTVRGVAACAHAQVDGKGLLYMVTDGGRFRRVGLGAGEPDQPGKVAVVNAIDHFDVPTGGPVGRRTRGRLRF